MAASPASWALLNWPLEEWQGWNRGAREHAYKETSPLPGCVTLVTVTAPGLFICEEGHISPAYKNGLRINAAIRWVLRAQFLGDYSPPTPPVMAQPLWALLFVWPWEAGRVSETGGGEPQRTGQCSCLFAPGGGPALPAWCRFLCPPPQPWGRGPWERARP